MRGEARRTERGARSRSNRNGVAELGEVRVVEQVDDGALRHCKNCAQFGANAGRGEGGEGGAGGEGGYLAGRSARGERETGARRRNTAATAVDMRRAFRWYYTASCHRAALPRRSSRPNAPSPLPAWSANTAAVRRPGRGCERSMLGTPTNAATRARPLRNVVTMTMNVTRRLTHLRKPAGRKLVPPRPLSSHWQLMIQTITEAAYFWNIHM
ncbi:acrosin [Gracilaria domingensis]|nr:acrosin [Gracilaria domingensis]